MAKKKATNKRIEAAKKKKKNGPKAVKRKKEKCGNCEGDGEVSVNMACPECVGRGNSEMYALRDLADYVRTIVRLERTSDTHLIKLVNSVGTAQGKDKIVKRAVLP